MEILFRIGKHNYSLTIGHKTDWFEQVPFIMLCQIWYGDDKNIAYASVIFDLGRKKNKASNEVNLCQKET